MTQINLPARHVATVLFFLLFFGTFPCMADRGEQLYMDNCAICHGQQGQGGVGIPLGLEAFLEQAPDEYIRRTIRVGRPGRIMPPFYRLSNEDIDAIIGHIRSWKDTEIPEWDDTPVKGDSEKGQALFARHCVSCHGEDARGGKGTGLMFSRPRDLPISPPALNNQGFLNSASDRMLKTIITEGREHTPMPPASQFGLSEQDINDLVRYIRSFQKTLVSGEQILEEPAVILYRSDHSFDKTIENIKRVVADSDFELTPHLTDDRRASDRVGYDDKQSMVLFCNYDMIFDALAIDPRIGMFLPCRITVVETRSGVQAMSINPKRLSQLFNNDELDEACEKMYNTYDRILKEATR